MEEILTFQISLLLIIKGAKKAKQNNRSNEEIPRSTIIYTSTRKSWEQGQVDARYTFSVFYLHRTS